MLSRQRSRVRVSSSPPFLIKHLRLWKNFRVGTKRYKFRAQLPYNNVYVQPRPRGLIAPFRALDQLLFAISNDQRDNSGVGCTLGGCQRLGVSIQGHADRGVSQQFLHYFQIRSHGPKQCGVRVPDYAESAVPQMLLILKNAVPA
jgi:hypothetical protein